MFGQFGFEGVTRRLAAELSLSFLLVCEKTLIFMC